MLVVKIGGSAGVNLDAVCQDVAALVQRGEQVVLVHGASDETNKLSNQLGKPPRYVTSVSGVESRYTDRETLEIFEMAVAGKINTGLVERLQALGVNALGLTGLDGKLMQGPRKEAIRVIENGVRKILRDDYTGKIEQVNTTLLRLLLDNGYTPVIAPLALSYNNEALNVDGDRAAAAVASALGAQTLLILSNVPGLLRDVKDESSLIDQIPRNQIEKYAEYAKGRMKKKVLGSSEALEGGVERVILADARVPNPVLTALEEKGTVIK